MLAGGKKGMRRVMVAFFDKMSKYPFRPCQNKRTGVMKQRGIMHMAALPDTRYTLLARLAKASDAAAWREFAEIYEPAVVRFARRRGLQESDARDVAQETLAAVAQALPQWSNAAERRASFRAWLYTVARNLAINRLARRRDQRGNSAAVDAALNSTASPLLAAAFDREYRLAALAWAGQHVQREVSPDTWRAFWLTAIEGLPIPQAAARLGQAIGSVYAARSRVIARLKARIAALDETERDALCDQVESEMRKQAAAASAEEHAP